MSAAGGSIGNPRSAWSGASSVSAYQANMLHQRAKPSSASSSSKNHVPSGAPPISQRKYIAGFEPFVQASKLIKDIGHYKETRDKVDAFECEFKGKPAISFQLKLVIATGIAVHLILSFIRWQRDPDHFTFYEWGLGRKDSVLDL
ncbi:unnamed protein product [Amoebophrya sp. A120]|nr:unnamed protein product [Amoebophrya sp. A120]|eukprot:GSA120T00020105001.1